MSLCRHGIPLTHGCSVCAQEPPMSLDDELKHYDVCIRRWKDKLVECVQDKKYEEASFYARAVGNEYTRLSLTLEAERRKVEKSGSDQAHSPQ